MKGKVTCSSCGWSWNKSDSSQKDMYICHECGRDNSNNMKNGGWLDNYADGGSMQEHQENYNDSQAFAPEGFKGNGYSNVGRNYSPAWGGQFKNGGNVSTTQEGTTKRPILYVESKNDPRYRAYQDSLSLYNEYENRKKIITSGGKYYPTAETSNPVKFNKTETFNITNPNNPLVIQKVDDDFSYAKIGDKGNPELVVKTNKKIQPIKSETFTRKESKFKSSKEYDAAAKKMKNFSDAKGNINWIGYDIQKYKKPQQEIIVEDRQPVNTIENNLRPAGLVYGNTDLISTLPTIRPEAVSPNSYDVEYSGMRMNGPGGYYSGNQKLNTDEATALRAIEQANRQNEYWQNKYGKSANPKAIERLNTLKDNVTITPEYQMGGNVYPVNYVPQAQNGKLTFLQPTSDKLPQGYRIPYDTPSSERAMSIGGENGEPAYLIPSFKYGQPLNDPLGEFRKTGEHLGGPFKTWQEADEWERTVRHPAVEKGENIMFPQEQFQNGGKKKPIYVKSKNDPRYQAYQDSLMLHNATKDYYKHIKESSGKNLTENQKKKLIDEFYKADHEIYNYQKSNDYYDKKGNWTIGEDIEPIRRGVLKLHGDNYRVGNNNAAELAFSYYKEPEQQIIVKEQEKRQPISAIKNNLQPEGLVYGNTDLYSKLPTIRHKAKSAKSYKVKETTQGIYGPSTVDYEVIDPRNINVNDLGPGNTRSITPEYQMGGSIPGAVGFSYARTKGIPSNGPYAKKTLASAQNGVDMYENPMLARRVDNPNVNRSYYDPRLNTMNIGTDYNTWKDEYTGEPLTGDDLKYHQDKMLAHENYHAIQHSQDRDNYDIAHNTDNAQWAQMQKRPQMMTTDAVYNNFYNRSDFEDEQDYQEMINSYPESRILNENLLFDKVLDRQRYDNPANLEGEAKFYEDTGVDISKQQSEISLNPTRFQNGGEMRYYQNGLDWKPKGMENGGWLSKYDVAKDGVKTTTDETTIPILGNAPVGNKWLGNKLNSEGYITSTTKGGNRISFTGNQRADEWINKQVDSGKFGFDPVTGGTFPLKKPVKGRSKEDQFIGSETYYNLRAPEGFNTESQLAQIKKLPQFQQDIINAENEKRRKGYVNNNMQEVIKHPLFSPGYFTPEGAAIGALQGATKMGPDLYEGNYKGAAMDALMMLPLAPSAIKTAKPLIQKVSNELSINKNLSNILKEGKLQGLSDYEIAKNQMEQVGITSNQRKAYTPLLSEFAEKYIRPVGYGGTGFGNKTKLAQIIDNVKRGGFNTEEVMPTRLDAWKLYLGRPQVNNTFSLADTAPAIHPSYKPGSLKGMDIYNINSKQILNTIEPRIYPASFRNENYMDVLENPISISNDAEIMGGYNRIMTKQGTQYNDIWDLDPGIKFKSLFPNKVSENSLLENIFWKTDAQGVQSPRGIKIPVSKFFGKPFMSHGNISTTSNQYVEALKETIKDRLLFRENLSPEQIRQYTKDLTNLKNYPKYKQGGIIKDDRGQWAHPGEITEIGSNNITMQGVPYDVLGISDEGDTKLMKPGKNYKFKGKKVTEYPMANNGIRQEQKGLQNLDQLTNFTNYNKPQPGGWLNKYN